MSSGTLDTFPAGSFSPPLADSTVAALDAISKQGQMLIQDVRTWMSYVQQNPGDTAGVTALGNTVSTDVTNLNTAIGALPAIPVQG